MKQFAPDYPRDANNWIRFPPDKPLREQLFTPESMAHPARANLWMLQSIYQYVAESGETLLDITSGVGSLMLACKEGYRVILIELSEHFHKMQLDNAEKLGVEPVMLLGDCRDYLPIPCDHILFSPPYSSAMHNESSKKISAWAKERNWEGKSGHTHYVEDSAKNLGLLNAFMFGQQMRDIYKLCLESVRSGGTMTIIIQDFIRGGAVQEISDFAKHTCLKLGWQLDRHEQRWQPGTPFKALQKKKGHKVTETEEIIIMRKER